MIFIALLLTCADAVYSQYDPELLKPGQDSLGQNPLGHDSLGQNPLGHDSLIQDSLGQNPLGHDSLGQNPLEHDSLGQNPLVQDSLGQNALSQNLLGQNALSQETSGQNLLVQGAFNPDTSFEDLLSPEDQSHQDDYDNIDAPLKIPNPLLTSKYKTALDNFQQFSQKIWYHSRNPPKNFLTIAGLLLGMSRMMAGLSWDEYDSTYGSQAPYLLDIARAYPQAVVQDLDCILTQYTMSIKQIVEILNSHYVKMICAQRPDLCDQLISTVLHAEPYLQHHAEKLLLLGSYSQTYIDYFAEFKNAEKYDDFGLFVWAVKSKNKLKRLIHIGSLLESQFPQGCQPLTDLIGDAPRNKYQSLKIVL